MSNADDFIDVYSSMTAAEAKKAYFLTTKDLLDVPYQSESYGFGCGRPTKWYRVHHLEAAATAKHGAAVLAKKRAQRKKRQETLLQKEQAAQKAAQAMKENNNNNVGVVQQPMNNSTNKDAALLSSPTVSKKDLERLRKDIITAFKPLITWDHMRSRNAPNGCTIAAQIPRVLPEEFAALIGRPTDPTLKTLVKKGAWYSVTVSHETVFGTNDIVMSGKGGRYGCNSELALDPSIEMTIKFKPSDRTLSVAGWVGHIDTIGYGE